jgi:hypothetical protein
MEDSMLLAAFEPASKELAIFYIIGVALFALAAFAGTTVGRRTGGGAGLVGLGLGFTFFPQMWNTIDAAF